MSSTPDLPASQDLPMPQPSDVTNRAEADSLDARLDALESMAAMAANRPTKSPRAAAREQLAVEAAGVFVCAVAGAGLFHLAWWAFIA